MPRRNNYQGGQQYQSEQSVLQGARGHNQQGQGYQGGRNRNANQGGNRGGGRGGANQNRFQALADEGDFGSSYSQEGGQGGRNRGGGPQQQSGRGGRSGAATTDWRALVKHDAAAERPLWPLTCYSHLRSQPVGPEGRSEYPGGGGGPNDLEGEFTFEELRWSQMQAAACGAQSDQLRREFDAAAEAQQRQIEALSRARRPPSLGGPTIPPLESFLPPWHSLVATRPGSTMQGSTALSPSPFGSTALSPSPFGATPASPFGQAAGAFGRSPAPAFGGSAAQPAQSGSGFGRVVFGQQQQFGAGFGAGPSRPPPSLSPALQGTAFPGQPPQGAFGPPQVAQTNFGQPQQQPVLQPSPFGPPQQQPGVLPQSTGAFPAPRPHIEGGAQAQPGFGGQSQSPAMQPAASAQGSMQPSAGDDGAISEDDAIWRAPMFAIGCIPDKPPPPVYCQ